MTTKAETTKREVIRKAYGEHYDEVKNFLDEHGYCDARSKDGSTIGYNAHNVEWKNWNASYKWRPISLSGLETNNGWFSIEEHGLPKEDNVKYEVGTLCFDGTFILNSIQHTNNTVRISGGTHYRPIEQVKPPLY